MDLSKQKVAAATLKRYTGSDAKHFQEYILLTNFGEYLDRFAMDRKQPFSTGSTMSACHDPMTKISMISFNVGSPMAALIIELISFLKPKAVLMLGLCGGLRPNQKIGDYFNPVAAIREEGTSDVFLPKRCPSLSSFVIQRFVVHAYERANITYHSGVIHTTNVRFWEFNEHFKKSLSVERVQAIDMECATLFTVGFVSNVPVGAMMIISDKPLEKEGIKLHENANNFLRENADRHVKLGIQVLLDMQNRGDEIEFEF